MRAVADQAAKVDERFRAPVLAGAWAGLRPEELSGLRRHRVFLEPADLLVPRIEVREVLVEVGGRLHHQVPKTNGSASDVPIPHELVDMLRAHIDAFSQAGDDGLVFTAARGGPLRRNNFGKRVLGPAAERAIGKWISPHDLRRSYGALLIEAGMHVVAVSRLMRHDRIETTLRHYAGLLEGGERRAVERFSRFLSGAESDMDGAPRGLGATG